MFVCNSQSNLAKSAFQISLLGEGSGFFVGWIYTYLEFNLPGEVTSMTISSVNLANFVAHSSSKISRRKAKSFLHGLNLIKNFILQTLAFRKFSGLPTVVLMSAIAYNQLDDIFYSFHWLM